MSRIALYAILCFSSLLTFGLPSITEAQQKELSEIQLSMIAGEKTLFDTFQEIEGKTEFVFAYSKREIKNKSVMIDQTNWSLDALLKMISGQTNLSFKRVNETITVRSITNKENTPAIIDKVLQSKTVTGKVISMEDNEALPGVNVVEKGTTNGTVTNVEGEYTLTVSEGATLVFSSVGYSTTEMEVGNRSVVDLSMAQDIQQLQELVVVGYGTQQKKDVTGAISSVSAKEISDIPITSVDQALQGRAAGVQVIQNGGTPGGPIMVNIRGYGSTGSDEPLYVIDGVPIQAGSQNVRTGSSPLNSLNPNDIESIEILKDASAAAIYGARASAGVIIITTKKGRSGKPTINYDGYAGINKVNSRLDLMNRDQYLEYADNYIQFAEIDPVQVPDVFSEPTSSLPDTDWQDQIFNTATIQSHNISISGGNENSNFMVSANYFDQEGTIINTGFQRYTLRINSEFYVSDRIKVGENLLLSRTDRTRVPDRGARGILELAIRNSPLLPVYDENVRGGYAVANDVSIYGYTVDNPVALLNLHDETGENYNILGSLYGEIEIIEGLTYRLNLGLDFDYSDSRNYNEAYFTSNALLNSGLYRGRNQGFDPLIENLLTYRKSFDKHNLTALVGYTRQDFKSTFISARAAGVPAEAPVLGNFDPSLSIAIDESIGESTLISYLARVNYDFDNRYLLTASVRRDGSSKLAEGNKFDVFPSFSVGWKINNESFMENVTFIDELKLRGGYGEIGNVTPLGNYDYTSNIDQNFSYVLGEDENIVAGGVQRRVSNANLQWETVTMTNLGVDLSILNNNLAFTADYFVKNTTGMIRRGRYVPSQGIDPANENIGEMENKGFEMAMTYQKTAGLLNFSLTGNFTRVQNTLLKLDDEQGSFFDGGNTFDEWDDNDVIRNKEGESLSQFFGYQADGLFQQGDDFTAQPGAVPGDVRYVDVDNNGVIDSDDRTFIGTALPDFTYGLRATADYKGLDFSMFFQGVQGNDIFNAMKFFTENGSNLNNKNVSMLDAWTPQNTNTNLPRLGSESSNYLPSDRFVENGSYLRLQNITLGYRFNEGILSTLGGLSNLRLYLTGQNVFTLTGYSGINPEVGSFNGRATDIGVDEGNATPIPFGLILGLQVGL